MSGSINEARRIVTGFLQRRKEVIGVITFVFLLTVYLTHYAVIGLMTAENII